MIKLEPVSGYKEIFATKSFDRRVHKYFPRAILFYGGGDAIHRSYNAFLIMKSVLIPMESIT